MFKNDAAEFIYYRTYSRWNDTLGRRETWPETVERVVTFLKEERGDIVPEKVFKKIEKYMLQFDVMPSMRLVWTAGPAAKKENLAIYNCSGIAIDNLDTFAEILYLLSVGTGVGFSVQQKYVEKLPVIQPRTFNTYSFIIPDSREGWSDSIKVLLHKEFEGTKVEFDYSKIRKKGERLINFGGRSSGPEPLAIAHSFIKEIIDGARGRKLTSTEAHDIVCSIAECIVAGNVRRSACISLFDIDDNSMLNAKSGDNWPIKRMMANNSMVFDNKPTAQEFLKFWATVANNGTGEPGIFNLGSAKKNCPSRRDSSQIMCTNPCGEALLRNDGLCNLTSLILRENDDLEDVLEKVETATWLGCIQSTFTNFGYVNPTWKHNAVEERLLGVSLSGQMDVFRHGLVSADNLKAMKAKVLRVAKKASKILNINVPTACTVVKPEGTSSQLTDSSSGIHTRYSEYYIRRYRIGASDPLLQLLKSQGFKVVPEVGQEEGSANTYVVEFPIESPANSVTRKDMSALEQLEYYKRIQTHWCEMNASMTIYVKEEEWFEVGNWVYKNWDIVNGLAFLPYDGGIYKLAPYEEITKEQYKKMVENFPKIDYTKLSEFEKEDQTEGAKTYACTAGGCELV